MAQLFSIPTKKISIFFSQCVRPKGPSSLEPEDLRPAECRRQQRHRFVLLPPDLNIYLNLLRSGIDFINMFMSSFYRQRSPKSIVSSVFCTFGVWVRKSCLQNVDEIDPWYQFYQCSTNSFFACRFTLILIAHSVERKT